MKKILIIIAILIVLFIGLIVGVTVFAFANLDGLIKTGIEKGGTYATGVPTTVEEVDLELFAGTMSMDSLVIGNPPNFSTPHFLSLGQSSVQLNTDSTSSDLILVSSVDFTDIELYLDKGNDPSNYNAILENLKRFESDEQQAPADASGPKVVIDSLVLENIQVHVANMPGVSLLAGDVAVTIPRIELLNIGKDEPMGAGDVVNLVVKTVLSAAVEAGGGIIPGDVLGELTNGLSGLSSLSDLGIDSIGNVGDVLGNAGQQAQEALDDIAKQGEEAVEQATEQIEDAVDDVKKDIEDGINSIFGTKKDDG